MFLGLLSASVALFIYFVLIKPFTYWSGKGVPSYNFLSVWFQLLSRFLRYNTIDYVINKNYADFAGKRYAGVYQFFRPTLSLRDPELIKQITVKDFDYFVDHSQFIPDDTEPLWERNLLSLKGDKWRHMRAILSPSFTASKMKIMFGLISECGNQFAQYFQEHNSEIASIEMKDIFTRFTNDVIASTAFGVKCDSLRDRNNEFYKRGKTAMNSGSIFKIMKFVFYLMFPRVAKNLGIKLFNQETLNFFKNTIKYNIQQREENGIVRPDMIHLLIEARNEKPNKNKDSHNIPEERLETQRLTDIDIAAQALVFFFAGFDTVANLMSFMAYEIAVNPDIQERLQQEIDDILAECDSALTYEAATKMKYMDMVISETLRKWPASGALDRVCVKPYTIEPIKDGEKPIHLKIGDAVSLPVFGLHRDPQFYPEPLRFDPERFNNENKSNVNPYAYIPFGSGPRSCIGNRFALMETKLVFFHLLSHFNITVTPKTIIPLKLKGNQLQLTADGGFWLGLKRRNVS